MPVRGCLRVRPRAVHLPEAPPWWLAPQALGPTSCRPVAAELEVAHRCGLFGQFRKFKN